MPKDTTDPRYYDVVRRGDPAYRPHSKTKAGDPNRYGRPPKEVIAVEDMAGRQFKADKGKRQKVLSQGYFRKSIPASETYVPVKNERLGASGRMRFVRKKG